MLDNLLDCRVGEYAPSVGGWTSRGLFPRTRNRDRTCLYPVSPPHYRYLVRYEVDKAYGAEGHE